MKRYMLILLVLLAVTVTPVGSDGDFALRDPANDDHGPGTYIYPKNAAFEPYHGLFDLLFFSVVCLAQTVHFEMTMADLRNTWSAPEGFSHPLIEIYIDRHNGFGRVTTWQEGARVKFSREYPWDALLKVAPWQSSELILADTGDEFLRSPLRVTTVAGEKMIRVAVPLEKIGVPQSDWRYYVLIGSYDGFAEDNFRPVMAKPGEWHFGGGRDDVSEPQVIDLLAPGHGKYSQQRQLANYSIGQPSVLMPVGPGFLPGTGGFPWLLLLPITVILACVSWYVFTPGERRLKVRERFAVPGVFRFISPLGRNRLRGTRK